MSIFTERLRAERIRMGLKQADVAEYIGTSVQNYSAYETKREPSYEMLCKLAKLFDVSTDYLLGRTRDRDDINITLELATSFYKDQLDELERRFKDPQIRDRAKQIMESELMLLTNILLAEDFINRDLHDYYLNADGYCQVFNDILENISCIVRIKNHFVATFEQSEKSSESDYKFMVFEQANESFRSKLAEIISLLSKYHAHKMDLLRYEVGSI